MNMDIEYRNSLVKALLQAVMRASLKDGVTILMTGEIVDACLQVIAMMIAGSNDTQSPTKRREAIDQIAKKLLRKTIATQQEVAENGWPDGFVNRNASDIH